jgi:hypothetical protein
MMKFNLGARLMVASAALWLAGCGGGGGGIAGTGIADSGSLHLFLTDAPACGYDAVHITIDRVRVHQDANAADGASGWSEIVLSHPKRVNLLDLTNGVLAELGQTALPAGNYSQLRLVLASNGGADPLANSVTPSSTHVETALTTPSAQQSGLKLNVNMAVAPGQVADFVLDFDACKSIVKRGNSGNYNLKPVMAVIPYLGSAGQKVVGYVSTALTLASTNIVLQSGGVPVKATLPDSTGKFTLSPVPSGTYDLVISSPGHVTAVMTGVPVSSSAVTTVNTVSQGILPPVASMRDVSGTLTPATATVRALQTLTGASTVEIAWGAVDATSGAYGFTLPIDAPVKTTYAPNPAALGFTADTAAAGKYTLEAASAGTIKTQAVDTSALVPPVLFSFP